MMLAIDVKLGLAIVLAAGAVSCTPQTKRPELSDEKVDEESAKQDDLATNKILDVLQEFRDLGYPLIVAGADLCGKDTELQAGFVLMNTGSFPRHLRESATKILKLADGEFVVANVAAGSPAARAGLQRTDRLKLLNGEKYSAELDLREGKNYLAYERDGERRELVLVPEMACSYPIHMVFDNVLNAFADGKSIRFHYGLYSRLSKSSNQVIIAHEIAHNAAGHISSQTINSLLGTALDAVLISTTGIDPQTRAFGPLLVSPEFEAEADYLSLYIMAKAGLDIDGVESIWREMSLLNPTSDHSRGLLGVLRTHPTSPERFLSLQKTIDEIKAKQAAGEPLEPNYNN